MGVNVQASVEAQIFGANVLGMAFREEEGNTITTQFLVMPSELDENKSFGVEDIVKEINKTIYMIENDTNVLPDKVVGPIDENQINNALSVVGLDNATFTFMQTFIYYKGQKDISSENDSNDNAKNSKMIKLNMEYAIGIHIKGNKSNNGDFHFLDIKEAYINVWDTKRQNILERMKIWTLDQLEAK